MKTITKKVFSLCDDFNPDEGFQEEYDFLSEFYSNGCYIDYTARTAKSLKEEGFSADSISNRLVDLGAENGEEVLIEIDY